jgi:hypothetical protein
MRETLGGGQVMSACSAPVALANAPVPAVTARAKSKVNEFPKVTVPDAVPLTVPTLVEMVNVPM